MIAVDSSSWIAYFSGQPGEDVELIEHALANRQACLPPVVLTELLSEPRLPAELAALLGALPLLEPQTGYWQRAGALRAAALGRRYKAKLADVLIAQSCLDHKAPLLTRDRDFRHFVEIAALELVVI